MITKKKKEELYKRLSINIYFFLFIVFYGVGIELFVIINSYILAGYFTFIFLNFSEILKEIEKDRILLNAITVNKWRAI